MITTPTLFILGAGASVPYGFPTGRELLIQLTGGRVHPEWDDRELPSTKYYNEFRTRLEDSQATLVDQFFEQLDTNNEPELLRYGIRYVSQLIGLAEQRLLNKGTPVDKDGTDWFRVLFSRMKNGVTTPSEFFARNRVRFWTFNYDRLLEHLFQRALSSNFRLDRERAVKALGQLEVYHIHGQLGTLNLARPEDYAPFGYVENSVHYPNLVQRTKVCCSHSIRPENGPAARISEVTTWQNRVRVVFLGFGFDDVNLKKLGILGFQASQVEFWATCKEIPSTLPAHPKNCLPRYVPPMPGNPNTPKCYDSIQDLLNHLPD